MKTREEIVAKVARLEIRKLKIKKITAAYFVGTRAHTKLLETNASIRALNWALTEKGEHNG